MKLAASELQLDDLQHELGNLKRDPADATRGNDELFVLWFLLALVGERRDAARAALAGASGDGKVDAIFTDPDRQIVHVVQAKLREKETVREKTEDLAKFLGYAEALRGRRDDLKAQWAGTKIRADVQRRLEHVQDLLRSNPKYRLRLHFVTTGRFSVDEDWAKDQVDDGRDAPEIWSWPRVKELLDDYRDGVAGAPDLKLPIAPGAPGTSSWLVRKDAHLRSWVLAVSAEVIADVVKEHGETLFHRNIRGELGDTEVNRRISSSLRTNPERFWYLNNGLTVICRHGEIRDDVLNLRSAQIVNGQQTARQMRLLLQTADQEKLKKARVLLRVTEVAAAEPDFVPVVVQATNWQNKIKYSDLRSNEKQQIWLQRELRILGCAYQRKEQLLEGRPSLRIRKIDLAQAVAGCEWDCLPFRKGAEDLFKRRQDLRRGDEEYYNQIFASKDPYFYLARYWVVRRVREQLRAKGERKHLRWPVAFFVFDQLRAAIERDPRAFHEKQLNGSTGNRLKEMVDVVIASMYRFYQANRSESDAGGKPVLIDIDDFFKRPPANKDDVAPSSKRFRKWWRAGHNTGRGQFEHAEARFLRDLKHS